MQDPKQREMYEDLARSGLSPEDMMVRLIDSPERAATATPHSTQGYVIPYFNMFGKSVPFYRVRLFNSTPKYKQTKDSANYVYFPKGFKALADSSNYVIIAEGEKKAALACKLGIPCMALSGVDSWRNRTITLPKDTELTQGNKDQVKAKLPAQTDITEENSSTLSLGLQELIDYVTAHKKQVIICFDSDQDSGVKPSVQRAAATLGFELRFRGISFSHIRQIVLPPIDPTANSATHEVKIGLDDYLQAKGKDAFGELLKACLAKRSAFPRHPNIRDFLNKKLQKTMISRRDMQAVSIGILSDLDANGIRLTSPQEDQCYYFDFVTRKLLKTTFDSRAENVSGTPFGQFLYRRYGLSAADARLIVWLAAQFTGEDPVEEVSPHRVIARLKPSDDSVHYQVSDSQYVTVSSDGMELHDNGERGILFESGQVLPLDTEKLVKAFDEMATKGPALPNFWADVLSHVRLRDQDRQRKITALLYYMSPWLYRWRGMQLPVEMVIGESGSGKSTLCELRLNIIEGEARLRNAPTDLKDWHASIANTGGLHVTDNVQLVDRNLRQRLSDELCRIVTEPNPHIEQRRYYTNSDLMRIPIRAIFAITAIQQPFQNADLLQRAIILDLDKTSSLNADTPGITYDAEWRNNQLSKYGGREGWIAHHLVVLHKFFKLVNEKWNVKYQAKHRLINFEQSMMLMAEVFGEDGSWIPAYLSGIVEKGLSESDWTFEGIQVFSNFMRKHNPKADRITASQIAEWAQSQEDYEECEVLTSARRLGRYLQTHRSMVQTICGLQVSGTFGNRQTYKLVRPMVQISSSAAQ